MSTMHKAHLIALCVAGIVGGSAQASEKIYWTTDTGNRIAACYEAAIMA